MTVDCITIDTMEKAGIAFLANVRVPGGGRRIVLQPQDVERFIADGEAVAADHFGLTKDEYQEWLATDGYVQCSAKTTSGSRCKNHVSGGSYYEADKWKAAVGEYCATHGGPTSNVK
ncbi:hypothetical protein GOZ83_22025 [Agrobacterium vitis]|uniref:hypothetical protein n=1 Tax=Rhizobium/Agrobacterium group TaxID=227290 RepID=UPI0012E8F4A4|nr:MULTISPECIES: hypothetical protein [Rhizobium/Agrobacterium group]MCF1492064.1 hypothetical protein [Allorhizobium ampelinum]MVA47743.1 hypothetical protein [Agrobacterium vitis]